MNMQVEALSLPRACYNVALECTTVRWKKKKTNQTSPKGPGVNFWHTGMSSAFRLSLYKRCSIEISRGEFPTFQPYQFTSYGTSSHWIGWKTLQSLNERFRRKTPDKFCGVGETSQIMLNKQFQSICLLHWQCFIRIKLALWESDLTGQYHLGKTGKYKTFLETSLTLSEQPLSQDKGRQVQVFSVFM